jgi:hypothetical protein
MTKTLSSNSVPPKINKRKEERKERGREAATTQQVMPAWGGEVSVSHLADRSSTTARFTKPTQICPGCLSGQLWQGPHEFLLALCGLHPNSCIREALIPF